MSTTEAQSSSANESATIITFDNIPRSLRRGPPSVANTAATTLASESGSVLGPPANAFSRSITFFKPKTSKENEENGSGGDSNEGSWNVVLMDPPTPSSSRNRFARSSKDNQKLLIESLEGTAALGRLEPGDALKKINGKRIGPSYNAQRAMELMREKYNEEGFLSIAVGNDDGDDVLVQATLIKPKAKMTAEDLGITVWKWGVLVIKEIEPESLFSHTVLKATDHLTSINDILCEDMDPDTFHNLVKEFPSEITIVVKRGKQRWTGKFG